jgi:hypothetical protein
MDVNDVLVACAIVRMGDGNGMGDGFEKNMQCNA